MNQSERIPLSEWKRKTGISASRLAAWVGVNRSTWQSYEDGEFEPRDERKRAIRKLMDRLTAVLSHAAGVDELRPPRLPWEDTNVRD